MSVQSLLIESTERSPLIEFNVQNKTFLIEGSSIPEDTLAFYKPIFLWLDRYIDSGTGVKLIISLKFFNTSSSKCLFNIFKKIETLHKKGMSCTITWNHELKDTDMFESGTDFQNLLSVPFKIEVK